MLTIRTRQLAVFEPLQEQRFLKSLGDSLQRENAPLAELSSPIMAWLVDAGVQRARSFGFRWQSTIGQFLHLMAAVAPNFDLQPAIHAALLNPDVPLEERVQTAADDVPEAAWQAAEAAASSLGWHLAQDSFGMPTALRLALALRRALPQDLRDTAVKLETAVTASLPRADALGLKGEDALFVFAACERIYGADFAQRLEWAREIFGPGLAAALRPALLRARVALDTAAWL